MNTPLQLHLRYTLPGLTMGITLSHIGFTNYSELHKMFLLQELRMLFAFAGAVALAAVVFNFFMVDLPANRKTLHPGVIPGAVIFGTGWAISGSCPSIALVQVGEGQAAALFTVLGILFGVWIYRHVHRRFFRWDTGSCS